jgi:non-heme chloroperoxidase
MTLIKRRFCYTFRATQLQEKPMVLKICSARICLALILLAAMLTAIAPATLHAQDISGDWQGTLSAGKDLRIIVHIEKNAAENNAAEKKDADKAGKQDAAKAEKNSTEKNAPAKAEKNAWKAMLYSIDQGPDGIPVSSVTFQDSTLKLGLELIRATYEGKLSADGQSIKGVWIQGLPATLDLQRATKATAWPRDPSPHKVQFIMVDNGVKLEVLDWGGKGRPLVLLAGLGNTAHVFDKFAVKLTPKYHVYGITRRGFGDSSVPDSGYGADRLGDDVLAVIDALKLDHPVIAGHSIAGEELSSIGSRHPEKVAGLIYLDAGYQYAFYDRARGNLILDSLEVQKKLEQLRPGNEPQDTKPLMRELLQTSLPQLEKDLQEHLKDLESRGPPPDMPPPRFPAAVKGIMEGEQKYTEIHAPLLLIYAVPHSGGPPLNDPAIRAAAEARDEVNTNAQAQAFSSAAPQAIVVKLPHANHYVFDSNEADVLREMDAFIAGLK